MLKVQTVISLVPQQALRTRGVEHYLVRQGQKTLAVGDVLLATQAAPKLLVSPQRLRLYLLDPEFPKGTALRLPPSVSTEDLRRFCLLSWGSSAEDVLLYPIATALIIGCDATDTVHVLAGSSQEEMTYSRLQREFAPFEMQGSFSRPHAW